MTYVNRLYNDPTTLQQGYYCLLCEYIYEAVEDLREHFLTHNEATSFKYIELRPRKEPKLFEEDIFQCDLCWNIRIIYRANKKDMDLHWDFVHQKTLHMQTEKLIAPIPKYPKTFCGKCYKNYMNEKMLMLHVKVVHESKQCGTKLTLLPPPLHEYDFQRKFRCNVCLIVSDSYMDLERHFCRYHSDKTLYYTMIIWRHGGCKDYVEQYDKLYYCELCKEEFGRDFYDLLCHANRTHPLPITYHYSLGSDGFNEKFPAYKCF